MVLAGHPRLNASPPNVARWRRVTGREEHLDVPAANGKVMPLRHAWRPKAGRRGYRVRGGPTRPGGGRLSPRVRVRTQSSSANVVDQNARSFQGISIGAKAATGERYPRSATGVLSGQFRNPRKRTGSSAPTGRH